VVIDVSQLVELLKVGTKADELNGDLQDSTQGVEKNNSIARPA